MVMASDEEQADEAGDGGEVEDDERAEHGDQPSMTSASTSAAVIWTAAVMVSVMVASGYTVRGFDGP